MGLTTHWALRERGLEEAAPASDLGSQSCHILLLACLISNRPRTQTQIFLPLLPGSKEKEG